MKTNGHASPQQINPQEAARCALNFLARVSFTASERQAFDISEALLQAIANGVVVLSTGPQPDGTSPPEMIAEH